jgi:hypothetical protein
LKRREGPAKDPAGVITKSEREALNEDTMDFTMDELREFLEADHYDLSADPEFKERLREKLWDLVQSRLRRS